MNKVILMGRLTKDPEIRGEGTSLVARYSLAVDRKYTKGEEKQTDFLNCVCFSKTAEFAEKYLKKGIKIIVAGRIQTGSYTNKDGQKINTTDIIVEEHDFCESKSSESAPKETNDGDFMDMSKVDTSDMPF